MQLKDTSPTQHNAQHPQPSVHITFCPTSLESKWPKLLRQQTTDKPFFKPINHLVTIPFVSVITSCKLCQRACTANCLVGCLKIRIHNQTPIEHKTTVVNGWNKETERNKKSYGSSTNELSGWQQRSWNRYRWHSLFNRSCDVSHSQGIVGPFRVYTFRDMQWRIYTMVWYRLISMVTCYVTHHV